MDFEANKIHFMIRIFNVVLKTRKLYCSLENVYHKKYFKIDILLVDFPIFIMKIKQKSKGLFQAHFFLLSPWSSEWMASIQMIDSVDLRTVGN